MPHQALAELAMTMRAPILRLQLGTIQAMVISDPDLAHAALTTNDAALAWRPHLLSGYDIPAKTRVFINTYAMGRDPGIWNKPLEFRPERF
ncbi:cytochrome P450 71D6-like [Panicum miliaceum]|uniref:Cytochrome P450 71D6-like n=1 Tax=Panicum miliaceum TaxID=4540 RepID=A0A3L6Q2S3_PANMI|nr:cytochrome P450 71D6-like [Panicum miliaceum]